MPRNHYIVLGVSDDSTQEQIQDAYRRRAMRLHPDCSGDESGPFLEVQEAYAVLSDPDRRRQYDRALHPGVGRVTVRTGPAGWSRIEEAAAVEPLIPDDAATEDLTDVSLSRSFDTYRSRAEELFHRLSGSYDDSARRKSGRTEALHVDVPLSRQRALRGGHARVLVPARVACRTCLGRGGVGFLECWRCRGTGTVGGEFPLLVPIPAGMTADHTVGVSLDDLGIRNLHMLVHFRISDLG